MCGICAIVAGRDEPARETIERMVASLAHRGPDAAGILRLPRCHLGHARLSIIDLCSGAQPMEDAGGRYRITFNGELYNYREIRKGLEKKGYAFRTHSDTEVVLAAFSDEGPKCLDRFRGMFAFAIWDDRDGRLFAARDLFGEKPLYHAFAPDGALFVASEIKAILAAGAIDPRLDRASVDAYLALGYIPPDRTIYETVSVLPPGHYMEWDGTAIRTTRYWAPDFDIRPISLDDAAERLRELLGRAVERQMVADVPVGAFLSGGLDSSSIVALMHRQGVPPVKTFSVGFGRLINELPYARKVARLYGTEHHEVDLGEPPVAETLVQMTEVYDEPFADSSNIPTFLISKFARRHVKVVLSGDGGDELFGGYAWYPALAMAETVSRSWSKWVLLRTASRMAGHRHGRLRIYSGALGLAARWPDPLERVLAAHTVTPVAERLKLWGGRFPGGAPFSPGGYYSPAAGTDGLDIAFRHDLACYLPGDILVKVDRAAMANGLETRAPFLDRDLVEFALSLPASLKVKDNQMKIVLKKACSDYWPPELRSREKQGFGAPYRTWLGRADVQALVHRVKAPGSPLRRLLPGLGSDPGIGLNNKGWILLTLGLWLERRGETCLPA